LNAPIDIHRNRRKQIPPPKNASSTIRGICNARALGVKDRLHDDQPQLGEGVVPIIEQGAWRPTPEAPKKR
jgi:hypothetical protein